MSISCHIHLPTDVRVENLFEVIGILIGEKKEKAFFENYHPSKRIKERTRDFDHIKVFNIATDYDQSEKNVYYCATNRPSSFILRINHNPFDEYEHMAFCYFEKDHLFISGGSNPFWKTLGIHLIKFFGGYIDFNDCDDIAVDLEYGWRVGRNSHESDEDFICFQQALWDLQPIWEKKQKNKAT